ncbi:VanZ family protein [Bacillus sp. FJAT-50079]|uniref:VanZ family protein n=1 Tax=Bacillus sp. FJAT-50079 TaxID=2833577 RepID=UPI001BCA2BD1|nr:VanZ family protein [Bacillus sp. FJAT-50079]MBS4209263.1 VanZ family protein [Bacillus sp. FJAT-50079]
MIEFIILIGIITLLVLDFIRHRKKQPLRRIIFYSFLFYGLYVLKLTTGFFIFPPIQEARLIRIQPIPFYFIADWVQMYQHQGFNWFFWNSVKLTFYNLIMLAPLGIYLSLLFRVKNWKKATLIVFLTSLTIETMQLILSHFGLISARTFNVDDLLLNTLGGLVGFIVWNTAISYLRK